MPDSSLKSRREDIHTLRADTEPVDAPAYVSGEQVIDLGPYFEALWHRRRAIVLAALLAAVFTTLFTSLLVHKTYRAMAILRPVPKAATAGRIAGMFGQIGGTLSPLSMLSGGGPGGDEAQEYMTILQSFAFNTDLIERHHLSGELLKPPSNAFSRWLQSGDPRWRRYRALLRNFECEYSSKTGNLKLYYAASTRAEAERMLEYYIDDLRERLRAREVQGAKAAINSMKDEARLTSDALLQTQLYELIAKQMQQLKLAQVQADFAFTLLEPPAAPDKPYRPRVLLDAAITAFLVFLLSCTWVAFWELGPSLRR